MKPKTYPLRVAIFASLLTLLFCPAVAAQQDSRFVGCWTFTYVDPDYSTGKMRLILKANGEAGEFKINASGSQTSGGWGNKWVVRGNTIAVKSGEFPGDLDFEDVGWSALFRFDGSRLRGWYFNDKGDSPDNIRYYGTRDAACAETDPPPASASVAPSTMSPTYAPQPASASAASNAPVSNNPGGGANPNAARPSNASTSEATDDDPDETDVDISDWTETSPGGEHKAIYVRNNLKKRTIRLTHLQVFNCKNLAPWDCTVKDVNIVLPPGASSSIGVIGNDVTLKDRSFSFNYKVWAKFEDDGPNRRQGRRP